MADEAVIVLPLGVEALPGADSPAVALGEGSASSSTVYAQKIFDTSLGKWCTWVSSTKNSTPAVGDTEPNNTGNFLAGSHAANPVTQ